MKKLNQVVEFDESTIEQSVSSKNQTKTQMKTNDTKDESNQQKMSSTFGNTFGSGQGSSSKRNKSISNKKKKQRDASDSKKRKRSNSIFVSIDWNTKKMRAFFDSISKNQRLDLAKLHNLCLKRFKELGEMVYQIVKKALFNNKAIIDLRSYCLQVSKFMGLDLEALKDLYFHLIDNNKDRFVCDGDLFWFLSQATSTQNTLYIMNDVLII